MEPSYEYVPGSRLPPKKVYVLQGTRGYEVDQVICVEGAMEKEKRRKEMMEKQAACQESRGINVSIESKGESACV